MHLNFDLSYSDLYSNIGLTKIDDIFLDFLEKEDQALYAEIIYARKTCIKNFSPNLLIDLSKKLELFLGKVFKIEAELKDYYQKRSYSKQLYDIKRNFIHRYALQKFKKEDIDKPIAENDFLNLIGSQKVDNNIIDRLFITSFLDLKEGSAEYQIFAKYAASRVYYGKNTPLFSKPEKQDFENLIKFSKNGNLLWKNEVAQLPENVDRITYSYSESSYCINCHKTYKDSCRTGLKDASGSFQVNPLNNILKGCPLDIKISEMNEVFSDGFSIAALGIITIDNPLVAATGKRICNDCSKACIFQKQQPVDIPSIESQILEDVLKLSFGFEIYSLLTRWQPLRPQEFLPKSFNGNKILIVGTGPSGIALSHYLLQGGCYVVTIDGLKIEKLATELVNNPIENFGQVRENYQAIKPQGFGGVAEYGITDRWDKTNLISLRLLLEKRENFELYGGIKFGANITYEQAKENGFKHIALCCGSGYPNIPIIKNIQAGLIKSANDFLMALGSGGALLDDTNTNYMIELPAIVIGAGLTAIDAATEITKYYPKLAKSIFKKLENFDLKLLTEKEQKQAKRIIGHAKIYIDEDTLATKENRKADYRKITDVFGGVTICYRKNIKQSPAYKINHQELESALNAGVKIFEYTDIEKIEIDEDGNCAGLKTTEDEILLAKTIMFATGTTPLTIEDAIGCQNEYKDISIFGDMDKSYAGSVVKALASAKDNYKKILSALSEHKNYDIIPKHKELFEARIIDNISHGRDIVELKVKCPLQAANYKAGQFFKLQNFHTRLVKSFEPLALSGAWVENDTISFFIHIVGKSSYQASKLKKGELVSLMGPLGEASNVLTNSSIILIAEGVANLTLLPYAKALKEQGNKILFLASYTKKEHAIYKERIIELADFALFSCEEENFFDDGINYKSIQGPVIDGMKQFDLKGIKNLFVSGSTSLFEKVSNFIGNYKTNNIANVNAPMQCMLGGVCGSCLIPVTEIKEPNQNIKLVFACKHQEQKLTYELVRNLKSRLQQNLLLEKLY